MKYKSFGKPSKISASSRASVKIGESFYTFESSMEVNFNEDVLENENFNLQKEWELLFDELNNQVDKQIDDVEHAYKCANS